MSRDAAGELRLELCFAWFKLLESGEQTFQHRCGLFGGVGVLVAEPSPDLHQATRLDHSIVNAHGPLPLTRGLPKLEIESRLLSGFLNCHGEDAKSDRDGQCDGGQGKPHMFPPPLVDSERTH